MYHVWLFRMCVPTLAQKIARRILIWRPTCCKFDVVKLSVVHDAAFVSDGLGEWRLSTRLYRGEFVDLWTCLLYVYGKDCTYRFQSRWCLAAYWQRLVAMVRLNRLDCPLVCQWYTVVIKCLTSKYLHTNIKNLSMNCSLLSVKRYVERLYEMIQWLRKMFPMCVDNALVMRIAPVSLEYRSVMRHMYWLPWFVFGSDPICPSQWNRGVRML